MDIAGMGLVERLCLNHERQLLKHLTRMLGNPEQAREAAQDSFVALLVKYASEKVEFPRAALFKIATRFALMQLRRRRMECRYWGQPLDIEYVKDVVPGDDALLPDQQVMAEQIRNHLAATLQDLRPAYRNVFVMGLIEGKNRKEIAAAVGVSEKRVDKRMGKAIKMCRARLAAQGMRVADLLG
jgi:RNA polymerase sigma factor (sigma-70 family)